MHTEMRYRLVSKENGRWMVLDTETDGAAELHQHGVMTLDDLAYDEALAWWRMLNGLLGGALH